MHIFGNGAGARGGDGGERGQQSLIGYPDRGERAKIDARRASRVRRTRGVFTCRVRRALDVRRALRCDLATVLLRMLCNSNYSSSFGKSYPVIVKI